MVKRGDTYNAVSDRPLDQLAIRAGTDLPGGVDKSVGDDRGGYIFGFIQGRRV